MPTVSSPTPDPAQDPADPQDPSVRPTETDEEPNQPPPDAATETGDDEIPLGQRQMNEAMGRTDPDTDQDRNRYPPGADVANADNVRRYPELFSDEDRERFAGSDEELPETDVERAQREQAEAAEQDEDEGTVTGTDPDPTDTA